LDPLSTRRATTAIAELCEHLTATKTRYPGTDLILRYQIKPGPAHTRISLHVQTLTPGLSGFR